MEQQIEDSWVTCAELRAALDRCMASHPPEGIELRLHVDANSLSDVWIPLMMEGLARLPRSDVPEKTLEALARWAPKSTS